MDNNNLKTTTASINQVEYGLATIPSSNPTSSTPPTSYPTPDELERTQSLHFTTIEQWGNSGPRVCGVKVWSVLSYELVQIWNSVYLQERLKNNE